MQFKASPPDVVRSVRHRWLLNYWQRLRRDQRAPLWKTLDVEELSRMVDNMQFCDIVEEQGALRFLVRFCGARIDQAYGECNDQFLDDKLPPLLRDATLAAYRQTAVSGSPVYTVSQVPDREGKPVSFERLLLPFARDGINIDRVLTMLGVGQCRRRFQRRQVAEIAVRGPSLFHLRYDRRHRGRYGRALTTDHGQSLPTAAHAHPSCVTIGSIAARAAEKSRPVGG